MSLTEAENEKLSFWLDEIESGKAHLNGWELGFYEDQVKRFAEFGANIRLSAKQWNVIQRCYEKATGG